MNPFKLFWVRISDTLRTNNNGKVIALMIQSGEAFLFNDLLLIHNPFWSPDSGDQ